MDIATLWSSADSLKELFKTMGQVDELGDKYIYTWLP